MNNEEIKEVRQRCKLTIKKACEITGVPYKTWQNWEAGIRVPPNYVKKMVIEKLEMNEH